MPPESEEGIGPYLGRFLRSLALGAEKSGACAKASATACRGHSTLSNERGLPKPYPRDLTTEEGPNIESRPNSSGNRKRDSLLLSRQSKNDDSTGITSKESL